MVAPSPGLKTLLERWMTDTVTITHTTSTPVDDAIDPNTLKPIPNAGETPTTVYSGRCFIVPRGNRLTAPGSAPIEVDAYDILIPPDADLPATGDKATMGTAADPSMVDAVLTVETVERSSFSGARVIRCRDLIPARPIHG